MWSTLQSSARLAFTAQRISIAKARQSKPGPKLAEVAGAEADAE
ncbi:MAG TPA: hypothetical protein VE027_09300 [Acidimicrobiia bacterium]|jgi:hypothetical protein|nr:hypothetical protein [Acidimicrobiia bacterium]